MPILYFQVTKSMMLVNHVNHDGWIFRGLGRLGDDMNHDNDALAPISDEYECWPVTMMTVMHNCIAYCKAPLQASFWTWMIYLILGASCERCTFFIIVSSLT